MDTRVKNALGIALVAVIVILGGIAAWKLIVWQPPVAQTGTVLGGGSAQTQSGGYAGSANTGGSGQRELPRGYTHPQSGADSAVGGGFWWPIDRINPEKNPIRQGAEGNWEDLTDGQWLMPDGTTYVGIRPVDSNGQKYGIWLQEGPYGLTGPEVLQKLVPNADDRKWVVRVSPEGPLTGGWWTIEVVKPGASESLVPGLLVPSGGKLITFSTSVGGRFDYWRGFAAPTPSGICTDVASQDADSGLDNWQIACEVGSNATFKSDGVSWYPEYDGFFLPSE